MKLRKRTVLSLLLALVLLAVINAIFYSCRAQELLDEEIETTDRDPATGIVRGTEPLTLEGDSDRACLCIHGWIGSRIDFHDLGARLQEQGWKVHFMLLPGHGTTPRDLERVEADDYIAAVTAEFERLEERHAEVAVIGFSMGGALATILAADHPVDKLVLIAPYYEITYRWYYLLPVETWNILLRPFVSYLIKSKAFVRVNKPESKDRIYTYRIIPMRAVSVLGEVARRAHAQEVLERITCPVLWLHSHGDEAAAPGAAEAVFRSMPSSVKDSLWCDRSDHHILWDYDGAQAADKIISFLDGE